MITKKTPSMELLELGRTRAMRGESAKHRYGDEEEENKHRRIKLTDGALNGTFG
jgi:hypothetical protein